MKKLLIIVLFLFISSIAWAIGENKNSGDSLTVKKKSVKVEQPSIGGDIEDEEEFEEDADTTSILKSIASAKNYFSDSMLIPAWDIYQHWNTEVIHPLRTDLTNLNDTIQIALIDKEFECDYTHPYFGEVTSDFGPRKYRYHYGIDIKLETGDTVFAAFDGVVRIAKYSKTYGNVVLIRHFNGLETLYAHLSKIDVEIGQEVVTGQAIGLGGNTGRSTGSHLHFEVRYKGEPINPHSIIDFKDGKLKADMLALNKSHFSYLKEIKSIKYHTVRKGETLSSIARKYKTSVKTLCKLNKIKPNSVIKAGKKIRVA
ncbi:MAG: peptidoglycan DD-metalloendopeptidase family protein [Bacteroidia bacterium]